MSCPFSPAWSLSPGSRDEDGDGAPHGASPVLGSCTRTPKCPPFRLKHVCFPRTPFSVLAHQDSPGPGHRREEEPASGPASRAQAPSRGAQLGTGGTSAPVSWVLCLRWLPVHPSAGPFFPRFGHHVSMATRSPCRRGILGSPLPAPHLYSQPLSPARRWQPARPGIHFKAAFVLLVK